MSALENLISKDLKSSQNAEEEKNKNKLIIDH